MYHLILYLLPIANRFSGVLSIILFFYWIYQIKSTRYQIKIQQKARTNHEDIKKQILAYNLLNPGYEIKLTTSWLEYQKYLLAKRNNTLLLSFVLAYVSFNTTSFYENENENFFKLLTISTTLFLAGITYIRQRYRE